MMLFTLVRVGIAAVLFAICAYLIRRLKAKNRRILLIAAGIVAMIVCLFLHQIPLENACVSFPSPESAYRYATAGTVNGGEVRLVVSGTYSDLVVARAHADTMTLLAVPKSGAGWGIGLYQDLKLKQSDVLGNAEFFLYQYRDTGDCYINAVNLDGEPLEIADNRGTIFYCVEETLGNSRFDLYYGYVMQPDPTYQLTINGETALLFEAG